ncbi:MAG: hypothetical protein J6N76_03925, partial [Lachnospiraceae bacterium]|nr:hypothetical protein [Lachnospiraceae bacterium]
MKESVKKSVGYEIQAEKRDELFINQEKDKNILTENIKNEKPLFTDEEEELSGNIFALSEKRDAKIEEVISNMPPDYNTSLAGIEELMHTILSDSRMASGYRKVRTAAKVYFNADSKEKKQRALFNIYRSAQVYLNERGERSRKSRKTNCEKLIANLSRYMSTEPAFSGMKGVDYLLTDIELTDDEINSEIALALDTTKGVISKKYADVSDRSRRNAFKRKIKDSRKAVALLRERSAYDEEYDKKLREAKIRLGIKLSDEEDEKGRKSYHKPDPADEAIKAYLSLYSNKDSLIINNGIPLENMPLELIRAMNCDDESPEVVTKAQFIETILSSILTWDMNEFAFKKKEDFIKKANMRELLDKLRLAENADDLLDELKRLGHEADGVDYDLSDMQMDELRARISFLQEVGREYETRIKLMASPYFALLTEEDFATLSPQRINDLISENELPEEFVLYLTNVE